MKIYIDADACPVNEITIKIAQEENIPVIIVKSYAHFSHTNPDDVEVIYVDTGAEAADYRIMQLAQKGDIIITQDYGLAALGLGKGCIVLHHTGFAYTNENIDRLLQSRYASAQARKSGQRTKGPKPFTDLDRQQFSTCLLNALRS